MIDDDNFFAHHIYNIITYSLRSSIESVATPSLCIHNATLWNKFDIVDEETIITQLIIMQLKSYSRLINRHRPTSRISSLVEVVVLVWTIDHQFTIGGMFCSFIILGG